MKPDLELRARLDDLARSIPVDTDAALARVRAGTTSARGIRRGAMMAIAAVVVALVVLVRLQWPAMNGSFVVDPRSELTGRIVMAVRVVSGANALVVHDLASGEDTPVDYGDGTPTSAAWSPDGTQIAVTVELGGGTGYALRVVASDGHVSPRTVRAFPKAEGTLGPDFVSVAWSPDGKMLAFSGRTIYRGRTVSIIETDGTNERVLDGHWESVSWSPDGARLLLRGWPDGRGLEDQHHLWTMSPDGSNLRQLTDAVVGEQGAAWSPDGSMVAFSRAPLPGNETQADVYVMAADGTEARAITPAVGLNLVPVWAPNGEWIAYATNRDLEHPSGASLLPDGTFALAVASRDGTETRALLMRPGQITVPLSWAP